jgi:predicted PurR-regulated permease PerM
VGTVLVPWSILSFATGDKLLGIGLLVIFIVNTLIRQLAEPHIIGKNLNLPPIITLVSIYVGYSLFGIVGVVVFPLISVGILAALNRNNAAEVG